MAQEFKRGDRVEWNSGSGTAVGEIQAYVTAPTEVAGHAVDASEDSPRYLVKNLHTGTVTGHRPEALRLANSDRDRSDSSESSSNGQDRNPDILEEFNAVVNLTAKQLQDWLKTEASQSVGIDAGDGEAKGHKSGKRIAEILQKHKADYTDSDYSHMRKVVGYVHRHAAQRPAGDIEDTAWRYSLMNWGHDPLKGK